MTFSSATSQFSIHSPPLIGRLVISVIDSALSTAKLAKLLCCSDCGIVYRRQSSAKTSPYHVTCFAPFPRLLIHLSELFTTRSSGRPIRFLRIVTPTGRGKTAHAVNAHALIVANVDSHVRWKLFLLCLIFDVHHLFDRSKLLILTQKFIGSMVPWVQENLIQKSCPRIGIPVPSRTKHAAGHRCWMKNGVCVICHMELRFGLHRTGSRKFYSTLMKDLIDDYNAMIARRPCRGSWILRVWSVNWWTSLQIP